MNATVAKDPPATILAVDDLPGNLELLAEELQRHGYHVVVAQEGEEALERAAFVRPDLILLDVMMPGMDGLETCRRLKANPDTRDIPVIFMTALDAVHDKVAGFEAGGVDYVAKPFQLDELLARVGTQVELRRADQRLTTQNQQLLAEVAIRRQAEVALQKASDELEQRVATRTAELAAANARLQAEVEERRRAEEALRASQLLLQAIADNSEAVIYVKDGEGRYLLANRRCSEVLQVAGGIAVEADDGAALLPSADRLVLDTGQPLEAEEEIPQQDGLHTYLSVKAPLTDAEGKPYAVCGIATDITERKKAEALRAGENWILEMIAANGPLEHILTSIVRLIESQSDGSLCAVGLVSEDGRQMRFGAAPSLPEAYARFVEARPIGPNAGVCGTAMHRRQAVFVTDTQEDPLCADSRDIYAVHGLRSVWSTPILSHDGTVLGSFATYYRVPRSPSPRELRLVDTATRMARIAIEHKRAGERVHYMANHDLLTGLPNRAVLWDRMRLAIAQANRNRNLMAVLYIDLDNFKHVNDSLGHRIGDCLLQEAARRLQGCLREGDGVARLGGDEFVIVLPGLDQGADASPVASKILEGLAKPFILEGHELHISGSIGVSVYPADGTDIDALVRAADTALYHAKQQGRGNFQYFTTTLNEVAQRRRAMAGRLRDALARGELSLHFQPQVELDSGRVCSAEALLRWRPPGAELVSSSEFVSVAEETGLILPIGEWVLREACRELQRWRSAGHPYLRVAVNLSVRQFHQAGFQDLAARILEESGLPPTALELEITESLLMERNPENLATLDRLAGMGVRLTVDDFGTGYSSLAYLRRFPIHVLKIDRSFVHGIGENPGDAAIVTAILAMARSLHLKVIAEGVENDAQADFLRRHGCETAQGYYFGRPVPAEAFAKLLETSNPCPPENCLPM